VLSGLAKAQIPRSNSIQILISSRQQNLKRKSFGWTAAKIGREKGEGGGSTAA